MGKTAIGVIGGSGLYEMEGLVNIREERISTPFGDPSDTFILGELEGIQLVFLPRHGKGHRLLPSEVNYRANIYGMKSLGVERIISVSAVGSMREEIVPGHIVIPDQFFDRTIGRRQTTFFGDGIAGHIQFADPICSCLAGRLVAAAEKVGATVHRGGTYICMEGPQFSTRAESNIFRSWGVDIIGMTNISEARLAREAEICYSTVALATDYDCWHEEHDDVSVDAVVALIKKNVALAKKIIRQAVSTLQDSRECACKDALQFAIMTDRAMIPDSTKEKVRVVMGKYLD